MPPRHLKSLTVSVALPAFLLGHEPWRRIFVISYGNELSSKHASDFRSIVESAWYRRAFPSNAELLVAWKMRYRPRLVGFENRHRCMEL